MVIKALTVLVLGFWGLLALWPEIRRRLVQPAPVPIRTDRRRSVRRPGGEAW